MPRFILHHRHEARECHAAFASWKGFASPLRHRPAAGSCVWGGHELWWHVMAASEHEALGQLPPYVAARTTAIRIGEVAIP